MIDNSVDIGDTVYIGGLFGKEFEKINNRFGVIKRMYQISITDQIISNVFDVDIDGAVETINDSYIYKIENFYNLDYPIHFKYSISNSILFYYKFHDIVGTPELIINENAQSMLMAKNLESLNIFFQLTNIN